MTTTYVSDRRIVVGHPRRRRLRLTATAPVLSRVQILDGRVTAADPGTRTITGLVVQWGAIGRTSAGPARFARGSIRAAEPRTVKLLVEHDVAQVVGYLTAMQETDQGLVATFTVPPGAAGDAVLQSAAQGLRDGLSVGVEVEAASPGADGVMEVTAGAWRETSLVAVPAFVGTRVTQVAASGAQPPPGAAFATQAALAPQNPAAGPPAALPAGAWAPAPPAAPWAPPPPAVAAGWQPVPAAWQYGQAPAAGGYQVVPRPMTFDQAVQRITAGWKSGGAEGALRAALSDVVPPTDAAQADALFRPQWLGELWSTSDTARPLIDCISKGVLTSFTVTGFRVVRPAFGVAPYAGNKTAVPSPGGYAVEVVTEKASRIAGAHDIDRAFIDLGDGSFVSSYFRYQAENYAVLTESQVATWLLAEATPLVGTGDTVLEALDQLAQYFANLGTAGGAARMSFVAISSDLWSALISISNQDAPWLYGGSAQLTAGTASVGGISMFLEATLPANTILAGDKRSATFYEWKNPPLALQALNIANGGVDLGVFGYCASIVNNPAALVTTGLAPVLPLADSQSAPEPRGKGK